MKLRIPIINKILEVKLETDIQSEIRRFIEERNKCSTSCEINIEIPLEEVLALRKDCDIKDIPIFQQSFEEFRTKGFIEQ